MISRTFFLRNARNKLSRRCRQPFNAITVLRRTPVARSLSGIPASGATDVSPPPKQSYQEAFRRSLEEPEEFWAEAAEGISWYKKWDKVLDNSKQPFTRWFVGGEMNTCYNAVDRHVEQGRGGQAAIIHDSPVTNTVDTLTYRQLQTQVENFAGVLSGLGVTKGDRVLIYMPMIPQALVAMLATARLGAIHSLVFGGFAAKELSVRINHAKPKVVCLASCGIEPGRIVSYKPLLDQAIQLSQHKPHKCVVFNRPMEKSELLAGRDVDWEESMSLAKPHDCVPILATDPLYILYTSGTTGLPKAPVRPSGGHAVVLHWSMHNIYGLKPGEVWWAASDLGWIVGHSYIAYSPLLHGNTTVLFEGKPVGTPDAGTFARVIEQHGVVSLFAAPTALRAIRREDPDGQLFSHYDLKNFRILFVAGEHCDIETAEWAHRVFGRVPVLDHWWQTETGWSITATNVGLGDRLNPPMGSTGKPVPGWDARVIRSNIEEAEPGELGNIVVKLPLPPGFMSTLWENDKKFKDHYFTDFPGYYNTMDAGYKDKEGYISVMSRTDDVINVAGHRLSAGALEEAVLRHSDLAECAVIGLKDSLKGHVPIGLCVLKSGIVKESSAIEKEVIQLVRELIGPVASFKQAVMVKHLPKTRSGKISRSTIAAMANGEPFKISPTIEYPTAYTEVRGALEAAGHQNMSLPT